jgi:2-polyprenyl-3-methyl-5-hydroxy-6-metoxy-1,4-benzoquinol methylase
MNGKLKMTYNCNTCGSEDNNDLFKIDKRLVVQCLNCDLTYIANPMTSQEAKEYYEQEYYEREYYSGTKGTASNSCDATGEQFRIKEANDQLDQIGSIDSLLDVGCGMGFFVKAASERGIKATGIDISQNAVDYGQNHNLDLRQGDLLYLNDFAKESFDVITFWASIEHLYKPKETLQKANSLLKPNGLIVLETGNFDSYLAKLSKSKWRLIKPDHNFYFSSKTLDNTLSEAGFETIHTNNDGFVESIITQLGLRKFTLDKFAQSSDDSKKLTSSLKEKINGFASKLQLGDVMIKYARKKV